MLAHLLSVLCTNCFDCLDAVDGTDSHRLIFFSFCLGRGKFKRALVHKNFCELFALGGESIDEVRFVGLVTVNDEFHIIGGCLLYTSDAADE